MRTLWYTFLSVHLGELKKYCSKDYFATDPAGTSLRPFSVDEITTLMTEQGQYYPVTRPMDYTSPYEGCEYGYTPDASLAYDFSIPNETPCTMSKPLRQARPDLSWSEYAYGNEKACVDDPNGRMRMRFDPPLPEYPMVVYSSVIYGVDTCTFCGMSTNDSLAPDQAGESQMVPAHVKNWTHADIWVKSCHEAGCVASSYCA